MTRSTLFTALVLSICSADWADATDRAPQTADAPQIEGRLMRAAPADQASQAEGSGPFAPFGENLLTQFDASDRCCSFTETCPPSGGPYVTGDRVTLNTYWMDTLPDPIPSDDWIVTRSVAVRKITPPKSTLILSEVEVNFGPLDGYGFIPGDVITFCAPVVVKVPVSCTEGDVAIQGHSVATPTGELPLAPSDTDGSEEIYCVSEPVT